MKPKKNITHKSIEELKEYWKSGSHKKNLKKISRIPDEHIDYSNIPELTENFWQNVKVVYPEKKEKYQFVLIKRCWISSNQKEEDTRVI